MESSKGAISPEAFYEEIGHAGGPDLAAFARCVVEQASAHGLTVSWGRGGPLLKFLHKKYLAFPFSFGQLHKSGVLSQRHNALKRRFREMHVPDEVVMDYLNAVAALIPGACVKTFPLPSGDSSDLIVASENAGSTDWPALAPLAMHREEWFAAIDKAVQGIRDVLDRRSGKRGERW